MSKDPNAKLANDLYSERVRRGTEPKYTPPVATPVQEEISRLDNLGKGLSSMYEGILKIPRFVYGLAAVPQNFLADQLDMPSLAANYDDFLKNTNTPIANSPLTMLDQLGDYYKGDAQAYEKKTRKYDENIISSIGKGNFKEAGSQILDQIVESAPSIAGMAMTSGAGGAANLGTVTKTLANGLPFMSQKNAELQDDTSIPEWKKPLVAGFNGLAEVMLDQKFGTQAAIEGVLRRFTNEGAEAALEAGKDIASSYIKKALSGTSKAVKPFLEGGIEEASTQFAQNMLDKYALGKDIDLMDGVADAAIVGSAMTGGISTAGNVASKIVQPKERSQVREIEGQQVELLNELSNPNLSPEAKVGVEQLINDNHDTIESIAKKTQEAIAKLNPEQKKEVDAISEKITTAEAVVNDPNVSQPVKDAAEKQIETLGKEIDAIKPLEAPQETKTTEVVKEPVQAKETPVEPEIETISQGIESMVQEADSKGEKSDEIEFLRNYSNEEKPTLISDVDSYVRNDHDILNSILRDGEELSLESVKKRTARTSESAIKEQYNDLKDVYENLEKGIKASEFINKKSDTKLYRNIFKNNEVFKNVAVGDIVSDPAFMSTTVDLEWAKNHNNVSSTLEINIPKGQKAKGLYVGKTEKEFILPRGTKLEITNIENKDGKQNITATLVDENTKNKEVATEDISQKRTEEVLTKANTDLEALKQVSNKPAKYKASVKRLNDAFRAGEISEQEFNDTKARFDDVIADSSPNVPKKETLTKEEITSLDNELANQDLTTDDFIQYERARAIEDANNATEAVQQPENDGAGVTGEVKPSETAQATEAEGKIAEIQERRQSIKDRISQKLKEQRSNLSSGIDPSLLSDFIELGATYIEEGVVKASDFIKRFREDAKELGIDDTTISDEDIVNEIMPKQEKGSDKFKKLTHKNIQSEEVSSTLNNVERETGRELTKEEKEYRVTKRNDALNHGYEVVEQAKEEFGDTYVGDLLNYLNDNASTISLENRALINISLELDLERQLQEDPDNTTLKKQLKLVRDASTKFQRSAAIATGYGILRQIARVGYDISQVTDQFFSEQQLEDKRKLEQAIQATPEDINKEADAQEAEINYDVEQAIAEGVQKEINALYEKLPSKRREAADKAIAALDRFQKSLRAKSYSDATGMVAFIDAGITTTKAAIRAGVNVADAVEMGITKIKELLGKPWAKENEFRKDMMSGFTKEGIDTKQGKKRSQPRTEEQKLDDAKKRIRERIEELNQQIQDKKRELKSSNRVTDQELRELQIEEAALKKEANQYLTPESKDLLKERYKNLTIKRLESDIASIEQQIADGEKTPKENGTVDSPEIARLRAERKAKIDVLNAIDGESQELVKQALVDSGFGREITVTTKDADGNKVKEKRQVLDWRKLAGEEGSIDNIQKNVETYLKGRGFSDVDISRMQESLIKEYNRLHASIIEKSLNELQSRNKERDPIDTKTSAKRLAELYNYGLFESESDAYDNIINRALGLSEVGQRAFDEAKVLAQALSDLYRTTDANGRRISEMGLKEAIRNINTKIEALLSDVAWEQSNRAFKIATVAKEYMGLSQRAMLQTLKQIIENPFSGYVQRAFTKLGYSLDGTDTGALSKKRTEAARIIYNDIDSNGGLNYGEIITPFVSKGMFEKKLDGLSDSKVYHTALSVLLGRAYLDAADSMHKSALTERYFVYNLVRVLMKKGLPKQEAVEYVSNSLTGQKFTDALGSAKQIIDKANQNAGKKILPDNPNAIYRLAQNIVKDALVVGENITLKEVEASYDAAYKAAGFDLGHEANNIISETVSNATSKLENKIKQAIKEKKWNYATALTFTSILTKNVVNPFVSGGTNWLVLSLQKAGVDVISPLVDYARQKENKLDLTTKDGVKNMENALLSEMRLKNTMNRVVLGAMASTLIAMGAIASGEDEDLAKWLKKNEWARKYFNIISPQALIFLISQENGELGKYLSGLFGVKYEGMGDASKIKEAFTGLTSPRKKDNEKGYKKLGEVLGGHTSFPAPWRVARDIQNLYRGKKGEKPLTPDYKKGGFWSGYYRNGIVEYYMLNQED